MAVRAGVGKGGGGDIREAQGSFRGVALGLVWWICSLGWFAASTKWRIKFEIVRAGKIARVRQSQRKRERGRKRAQ